MLREGAEEDRRSPENIRVLWDKIPSAPDSTGLESCKKILRVSDSRLVGSTPEICGGSSGTYLRASHCTTALGPGEVECMV